MTIVWDTHRVSREGGASDEVTIGDARINRRLFLQITAAAGAALAQSGPPVRKAKITSSAILRTLPGSFEQKIEIVARSGIQSVQLKDEYAVWSPPELERRKKFIQSFGLRIDSISPAPVKTKPVTSVLDSGQEANLNAALMWAKKLETDQIVVEGPAGRDGIQRAAGIAAKDDITLVFQSSAGQDAVRLAQEVDRPNFRLLVDLNANDLKQKAGDIIPWVAILRVDNDQDPNVQAVCRAIATAGYAGCLAFEYRPPGEPVDTLKRSVDAVRDALAGT